jgi:hypothetical protein
MQHGIIGGIVFWMGERQKALTNQLSFSKA